MPGESAWRGRRVVVTGAAGFLGRPTAARLRDLGAEVTGTSRQDQAPGGTWVRTPLDRAQQVDDLLMATAPDVLLHLGGAVTAASRPELVQPMFDTHLVSSLALLRAVDDGRLPRLVLVGSVEEPVLGAVPASPYGAAKAAMASFARLYASWGADVVLLRPAMVYGHGQAADKLLPYVARSALRGVSAELGGGTRLADWVYVEDVVDGIVLAADRAPAGSELDLGTGVLTSTREVVETLLAALGTQVPPRWGAQPDRPSETSRPAAVEVAQRLLGWQAHWSLQEGLASAAATWRAELVG